MSADKKLCIDLGFGNGGASRAFADAGWNVVGIDIERKFRPTICADYSTLPLRTELRPEVVLAAPDCRPFSLEAIWHYWDHGRPEPQTEKAIKTHLRMKEEIKRLNPRYAIIEQPVGMARKHFGRPTHTIRQSDFGRKHKKPTDLWELGRDRLSFKMLDSTRAWLPSPQGAHSLDKDEHSNSAKKAEWPIELSQAILEAVERPEMRSLG